VEHQENWDFHKNLVESEDSKFDKLFEEWDLKVKQFHVLK